MVISSVSLFPKGFSGPGLSGAHLDDWESLTLEIAFHGDT